MKPECAGCSEELYLELGDVTRGTKPWLCVCRYTLLSELCRA